VHVLDRSVPCSAVLCCAVDGGVLWIASLRDTCGGSQRKYFREGSIGQSTLFPRSDVAADTLSSRVSYRLLFRGHHKAVSVI
jgi:hypothetical protein